MTKLRRARLFLTAAVSAAFMASAGAALADQPTQLEQMSDRIDTGAQASKGLNFLVVPIPVVDPAIGNGVTLVTAVFYQPVKGGRQWVTGLGGMYTSNKDWAGGLAQQADLFDGKLRLMAFAGYGDFKLDFFGIGQDAGSQGRSIRLDERGAVGLANLLYRVSGPFYFGARYRFLQVDSKLDQPLFPNHPLIPDAELKTRISGLGPAFEYDTRDIEFNPHRGVYIQGQWLFNGDNLGSDFSYNKATFQANYYHALGARTVVALNGTLCNATHGAPFYDLCFFGSQHELRGYEGGQYRDHSMFAVQGELRQALFWKFGAVAFAGVGEVAPSFGDMGQATPLYSFGGGLRFQPSKKIPVNVSVDYAWGRKSSGLYLYVGEAF